MNSGRARKIRRAVHFFCTAKRDSGRKIGFAHQRRLYRHTKRFWSRCHEMPDFETLLLKTFRDK